MIFSIDVYIQAMHVSVSQAFIYIICLFLDKFMLLLFVYQLNSFSTGYKDLLQGNSFTVAIK